VRGKRQGRPKKWVSASMQETFRVFRPGVTFEIWNKWKRKKARTKLGTLVVSVGGLRWWPRQARRGSFRKRTWDDVKNWFETP